MRKLVRLTKITDCENPRYPNHIPAQHEEVGLLVDDPKVGQSFWVGHRWRTSVVTKIVDDSTFETLNSVYKWEVYETE